MFVASNATTSSWQVKSSLNSQEDVYSADKALLTFQ